jgi:predicted small secreted protein
MKRIFALIALGTLMLASGCNTVRGMGEDLRSAGSAIEKAANK